MPTSKVYFPQGAEELVIDAGGRVTTKVGGALGLPFLTPAKGAKASLKTGTSAGGNEVTITAKAIGAAGNAVSVAYIADEEVEAATVAVNGRTIEVACVVAEDAIITTAAEIVAAITASAAASELVIATGTGTSAVLAAEATALAGGKDTTAARKGDMCFDSSNIYIALDDIGITDIGANWKKIALSSL